VSRARPASTTTPARTRSCLRRQWSFIAASIVFLPFFFESPCWLVAHGRADKARQNLEKLHDAGYDFDGHMAEISENVAAQQQHSSSQGGMLECFSRDHWRRTLAATSMFFIQNACGSSWVIGYMACGFLDCSIFHLCATHANQQTLWNSRAWTPARPSTSPSASLASMAVSNMCGWFFIDLLAAAALLCTAPVCWLSRCS